MGNNTLGNAKILFASVHCLMQNVPSQCTMGKFPSLHWLTTMAKHKMGPHYHLTNNAYTESHYYRYDGAQKRIKAPSGYLLNLIRRFHISFLYIT